jgi:hypothetical protein
MSITNSPTLLRLAQDLEWLGCELEYEGMKHAHEGFPGSGPAWQAFTRMRDGVLTTITKIERELKASITYNPAVVGVDFPLEAAMDAIGVQLATLQEIRSCADYSVHELPGKVRGFTRLVESYLTAIGAVGR